MVSGGASPIVDVGAGAHLPGNDGAALVRSGYLVGLAVCRRLLGSGLPSGPRR